MQSRHSDVGRRRGILKGFEGGMCGKIGAPIHLAILCEKRAGIGNPYSRVGRIVMSIRDGFVEKDKVPAE